MLEKVNRIAVRMPNWLGDAVMATPALQALHNLFPNASVTVLVRDNLAELFSSCPFAEEVIPLPKVSGRRRISQLFGVASNLKRKKFDLAICLPHSFSSAWMFWLAGIPSRLGYSAEGRKSFLSQSLPYLSDGERPHRARFYCQLVELAGGQKQTIPSLQVWPKELEKEEEGVLMKKIKGIEHFVMIAPGSVGAAKRWFAERFAAIIRKLVDEKAMRVVLVGAPHDRPACEEIARLSGASPVNLAGATTLSELYFLVQKSRLFVGNDSGAGHLAAAAGAPAIILTGAGDPDEIAPWTEKKTVLFKKIFCSPCYRNICRRQDHPLECMDLIGTNEVWQAVEHWLSESEQSVGAP